MQSDDQTRNNPTDLNILRRGVSTSHPKALILGDIPHGDIFGGLSKHNTQTFEEHLIQVLNILESSRKDLYMGNTKLLIFYFS